MLGSLERETGIEPATNSLEGCDSTTELLPPILHPTPSAAPGSQSTRRFGGQAAAGILAPAAQTRGAAQSAACRQNNQRHQTEQPSRAMGYEVWWGWEGSNLRSH